MNYALGSKEFRHQYTLMRHLPTHTDERNFKCDVCGKAFRQLSTLSQHKAIHSDARPYVCEFCKKTFNRLIICDSTLPFSLSFSLPARLCYGNFILLVTRFIFKVR